MTIRCFCMIRSTFVLLTRCIDRVVWRTYRYKTARLVLSLRSLSAQRGWTPKIQWRLSGRERFRWWYLLRAKRRLLREILLLLGSKGGIFLWDRPKLLPRSFLINPQPSGTKLLYFFIFKKKQERRWMRLRGAKKKSSSLSSFSPLGPPIGTRGVSWTMD